MSKARDTEITSGGNGNRMNSIGYWNEWACGSDNRQAKMNYFKSVIKENTEVYSLYGIKIPNTVGPEKLKKFLKFFQNDTSVFPLKDAEDVTFVDTKEIIDWIDTNNMRLNLIAMDGIGLPAVDLAIRYVGEFNLKKNLQLFEKINLFLSKIK